MRKFFRSLRENFDKKKKKKKMKTSSTKLGNESKAVCKNKNKSFHLFLRRKSASEGKWKRKRLSLTFFYSGVRGAKSFWSRKTLAEEEKVFRSRVRLFERPSPPHARTVEEFFCLLSFSFCACRWKGNFFKSRMKFYDAAFVFSSQSATVNGGEEKSARGGS